LRNAIIGIVIGVVIGVVVGATVVAPRLTASEAKKSASIRVKVPVARPPNKQVLDKTEKLAPKEPAKEEKDLKATNKEEPPEAAASEAKTPAPETAEKAPPPPDKAKAPKPDKEKKPESLDMMADSASPTSTAKEPPDGGPPALHWKMASAYAGDLPQLGIMAKKLDRDIWRVSNGYLEIKFFEPGALVPPLEMFDAVRSGVIEAAFSSPGFWGNKLPALQLFAAVPFGPSAKEFLAWIYFGGGQALFNELYHAQGIHSLFCGMIAPEASGWFRKRIRTLEDLKGLKMRFFGLGAKVMQKLGVATTQLTSGDIFVAFESGDIDAAEFSMPAIDLKLGLHRMAKNYYFPGWHQPTTLFELMINQEKWETLSPAAKAQVEAVCGDNIRYGLAEGEAVQFKALKELQKNGVVLRRWPSEILEALETAWQEVAREESKANRGFNRVWKSLSAFRKEYEIWRELNLPN